MALATTCPQCKTSFKVVPDQLKLRRGLVRCGVCQHVFSGVEHLRYVDKDESTEKLTPGAPPASAASHASQPTGPQGTAPHSVPQSQPHPAPAQPPSYPTSPAGSQSVSAPETAPAAIAPSVPAEPEADAFGADVAEPATSSASTVTDAGQPSTGAASAPAAEEASASAKDTASFGDNGLSTERSNDDDANREASSAEADEATETHAPTDEPEAPAEAPAAAAAASPQGARESSSGGRSSRSRRRRARQERKQQQTIPRPPVAHEDDDLKTVFFMADNEDDTHPGDRQLPESLRAGARKTETGEATDPLDPDAVATGKLIDEANKIWRQHQPRSLTDSASETATTSTDRHRDASEGNTERDSSRSSRRSSRSKGPKGLLRRLTPMRRRIIAGFLALLALIQLLAVFRTEISYHLPFLRPLASLASTLTGQTIQPPMSLSTLSIESFELRATQEAGKTRLTAILRNRSTVAARWPAMELTLTGPSNALLVRKVLLPNQYLPASQDASRGIAANAEVPLDLVLDTGDLNLAGYSVALFYP